MADTDVLDMLFDSSNNLLGSGVGIEQDQLSSSLLTTAPEMTLTESDIDWNSLLQTNGLDQQDFFDLNLKDIGLMDTNLPDEIKEKQLQPKFSSDHAYSATPGSPNSDSGISNGPSSPSNSNNGLDNELIPFDLEQELFGPLDLKQYETPQMTDMDPMILDTWSDSNSSCSPEYKNDSSLNFDFGELMENSTTDPVSDLTISTDETTKVIKVLSVNNSKRPQSLLNTTTTTLNKQPPSTTKTTGYPELTLADEEKALLRKEGISLPTHLPLTREEEKILRSVRRRIRNKASARNSRRKKQDYMEALEERVKLCTEEKRQLEKKVNTLEKQNSTLIGQLRKLQKMVSDSTRQTAKTGTCAMILALSFALVVLPNFQSLIGDNSSEDGLMKTSAGGRPSRSLLSKPEDIINLETQEDMTTSYLPFFNLNKMVSLMSPAKKMADEPLDGLESPFKHDSVDTLSPGDSGADDTKVLHMEITKLPENPGVVVVEPAGKLGDAPNSSHVDVKPINPDQIIRHRTIRMDLDDEL